MRNGRFGEECRKAKLSRHRVLKKMRQMGWRCPRPWSQAFDRCQNPDCPHTEHLGKGRFRTSKRHRAHGLCSPCHKVSQYRSDPAERQKARVRAARNRDHEYQRRWRTEHQAQRNARSACAKRVRRAIGYDPRIRYGKEVESPVGAARVVSTFIEDGTAMATVDTGTEHHAFPFFLLRPAQ
jgi:hypothetical protein